MSLEMVKIRKLRPTQMTLGLREVSERAEKMKKYSPEKFQKLLEDKAAPYVLGPGGDMYIVDHHHLARALLAIDQDEMRLGEQKDDLSHLPVKSFWLEMERRDFCWPIDADGNRRPYAAIPVGIEDLTDNIWRSMARELRGKAYKNLDTPFQEFMWGDYFRTFMSRRLIETSYKDAVDLAARLARLSEAQDLPGYEGA